MQYLLDAVGTAAQRPHRMRAGAVSPAPCTSPARYQPGAVFHLVGDNLPALGAVPVVGGTPDGGQQVGPERASGPPPRRSRSRILAKVSATTSSASACPRTSCLA